MLDAGYYSAGKSGYGQGEEIEGSEDSGDLFHAKHPHHARGDARSRLGHRDQLAHAHHLEQLRTLRHETVERARVAIAQPPHLYRVGLGLGIVASASRIPISPT